ncbi:copper resistance protein CopC [Paraburkholderia sp. C35]|uniref:copper resistance CopC family protein n=1 Tax=Paraburkholderia sp. C35 TaxID=2126993 RepID=UPI000D68999F|nr:copper resistance protein CopC [Paraburkholderia sp. C35]
MISRLASLAWKTVCGLGLTLALSGIAFAHVFPRNQVPGAGASVASPPEVRIVFDGPLEPAFSSLTVTDAGEKQVNTARSAVDAQDHDAISLALPALQSGRYTVHWVAVASDGHRTHGDYSFEVK